LGPEYLKLEDDVHGCTNVSGARAHGRAKVEQCRSDCRGCARETATREEIDQNLIAAGWADQKKGSDPLSTPGIPEFLHNDWIHAFKTVAPRVEDITPILWIKYLW